MRLWAAAVDPDPALFAAFPGAAPATLFAPTRPGRCGHRHGHLAVQPPRGNALAVPAARSGSGFLQALCRCLTVTALVARLTRASCCRWCCWPCWLYTLAKKDLGRHHAPCFSGNAEGVGGQPGEAWALVCTTASLGRVPVVLRLPVRAPAGLRLPERPRPRPSCSTAPPTSRPSRCLPSRAMSGGNYAVTLAIANGGQHGRSTHMALAMAPVLCAAFSSWW